MEWWTIYDKIDQIKWWRVLFKHLSNRKKIECRPDTTITMMNGHVYIVKETIEEVIEKMIQYNRKIFGDN